MKKAGDGEDVGEGIDLSPPSEESSLVDRVGEGRWE